MEEQKWGRMFGNIVGIACTNFIEAFSYAAGALVAAKVVFGW